MPKNKNDSSGSIFVGVVLLLIITALLGYWFGYLASRGLCDCKITIETDIPDRKMINEFCESKGFEYGWLDSSSCVANEVMCHQKIYLNDGKKLDNFECVKWMK